MVKKVSQQNKKAVANSLAELIKNIGRGIGNLFELAVDLEKQGKSNYAEQGRIKGKTKSGKPIAGAYGFQMKIGLNPTDFKGPKRISAGSSGFIKDKNL